MEVDLNNMVSCLWGGVIKDYSFNIIKNEIVFQLFTVDNGKQMEYSLELFNVSAWFFINNTNKERKKFYKCEPDDYLELTSINIIQDAFLGADSIDEKWVREYSSSVNIAIEIWNSYLFIEAETIVINGFEYKLY